MNIKKNDKVKMLSGKDKGKTGKVLQVIPSEGKISVEGLNLLIKHLRAQRQGEKGQRIEFPSFVDASNVALICPKCGQAARIQHKVSEVEGKTKKYRTCQKCKEVID
jgi:large subunit ribosomal protein L24